MNHAIKATSSRKQDPAVDYFFAAAKRRSYDTLKLDGSRMRLFQRS
jgi:hypothetical protein